MVVLCNRNSDSPDLGRRVVPTECSDGRLINAQHLGGKRRAVRGYGRTRCHFVVWFLELRRSRGSTGLHQAPNFKIGSPLRYPIASIAMASSESGVVADLELRSRRYVVAIASFCPRWRGRGRDKARGSRLQARDRLSQNDVDRQPAQIETAVFGCRCPGSSGVADLACSRWLPGALCMRIQQSLMLMT